MMALHPILIRLTARSILQIKIKLVPANLERVSTRYWPASKREAALPTCEISIMLSSEEGMLTKRIQQIKIQTFLKRWTKMGTLREETAAMLLMKRSHCWASPRFATVMS